MSRNHGSKDAEQEVVPLAILITGLVFGGYVVWNRPFGGDIGYVWWTILGLSVLGIIYVVVGFRAIYRRKGLHSAVNWLFNGSDSTKNGSRPAKSTESKTEKTPPAPESLKNELYFERANQKCEWCNDRVDSPDVHHIEPRSEGGPNTPKNLIVLCPNCHRKADSETISRSKLKYKVNKQIVEQEA